MGKKVEEFTVFQVALSIVLVVDTQKWNMKQETKLIQMMLELQSQLMLFSIFLSKVRVFSPFAHKFDTISPSLRTLNETKWVFLVAKSGERLTKHLMKIVKYHGI